MKTARSCGFLIVRGEPLGSFLLMKHKQRWDLPKGHVDPGETDLECAYRELVEETGIAARDIVMDPTFRFEHEYEVRDRRYGPEPVQKSLLILLGRLVKDVEIVATEHESYQWFDWSPPHKIQTKTIDPLLKAVESHLEETSGKL